MLYAKQRLCWLVNATSLNMNPRYLLRIKMLGCYITHVSHSCGNYCYTTVGRVGGSYFRLKKLMCLKCVCSVFFSYYYDEGGG